MVFKAAVDGATTSGSKYARTELREMDGTEKAAWNLKNGGTLTATLKVDETPIKDGGTPGRVVVGQIHGQDEELVRLYFENGNAYFMNDQAGSSNKETKFTFKNDAGEQPDISLGETFSYMIDAHGKNLLVKIKADGQEYVSNLDQLRLELRHVLFQGRGVPGCERKHRQRRRAGVLLRAGFQPCWRRNWRMGCWRRNSRAGR